MGTISWSRVLFGGLVAGFVINVLVLGWAIGALHLTLAVGQQHAIAIVVLIATLVFFLTILVTGAYAVVRVRYGSGFVTALRVGVTTGLLLGLFEFVAWILASRLIPANVWAMDAAMTFVVLVMATLLGAWVYELRSSSPPSTGVN